MQRFEFSSVIRLGIAVCIAVSVLSGCSTPSTLTLEQLASLGVSEGAMYWYAEQKLLQEGYVCYVSGTKRENFDFTKQTGIFPACVLRIQFKVNDQNLVTICTSQTRHVLERHKSAYKAYRF